MPECRVASAPGLSRGRSQVVSTCPSDSGDTVPRPHWHYRTSAPGGGRRGGINSKIILADWLILLYRGRPRVCIVKLQNLHVFAI